MKTPFALDRRGFLFAGAATASAWLLPGCGPTSPAPQPMPMMPPGLLGVYDGLRALRDVVRVSPDHLTARAAAVIALRDPAWAIRFVRENIAVLPPSSGLSASTDAVRFGPVAALRCGGGTLRERADLLAAMLNAMGATARVVSAPRPASLTAEMLYRSRSPRYALDVSRLAAIATHVDTATLAQLASPTPDPDVAPVLARLQALLPAGSATMNPFDGVDAQVPLVEYTREGVTRWAYAVGDLDDVAAAPVSVSSPLEPVRLPLVGIKLLALTGDLFGAPTSKQLTVLAAGAWPADELAGQRVLISFPPPAGSASVEAAADAFTVRVPTITLQRRPDAGGTATWQPPSPSFLADQYLGKAVTLSGAVFEPPTTAGGPIEGPYGALTELDPASHAAALASVATVRATANAAAFPELEVSVAALDAGGAPISGLSAADFALTDDGLAQTVSLLSNATAPLKVLLAYDCSGSITWAQPADRTAFENTLASALVSSAAQTSYLLGTAAVGDAPADGYVAPDATRITSTLAICSSGSDLWSTLGAVALDAGVSAVVLVSDFDPTDDPAAIPALQHRLAASGLKVAVIPLGTTVKQAVLDEVVAVAKGTLLDASSPSFAQQLSQFVNGVTNRAATDFYRLRYRLTGATPAEQSMRTVAVTLAQRAANAPYQVPLVSARGSVGVAGLYVELRVGDVITQRWLSGPRRTPFGRYETPQPHHFEQTRALMNGLTTIAFEADSPTTSILVDELCSSALSLEAFTTLASRSTEQVLPALQQVTRASSSLAQLLTPIRGDDGATRVTPRHLRVVVMTESADATSVQRRIDVVPELNRSVAATTDAAESFRATMAASVGLCLREAESSLESSARTLADVELQLLPRYGSPSTLAGFSADDRTRWQNLFDQYTEWHCLVPLDPKTEAMWVVDPATGSTFSVFLDGTGGGASSCTRAGSEAALSAALTLFGFYCTMKSINCSDAAVATTAGAWTCHGTVQGSIASGVGAALLGVAFDDATFESVLWIVFGGLSNFLPKLPSVVAGIMSAVKGLSDASATYRTGC